MRYRFFYDQPKPVEVDVELPDDIEGPEDLRECILGCAPIQRVDAVRFVRIDEDEVP